MTEQTEPQPQDAKTLAAMALELAMTCLRCGFRMSDRSCRRVCDRCGYFEDCSNMI